MATAFYGANGHFDYPQSPEEQIGFLRNMGMEPGFYRVAYEGSEQSLDYLERMAQALQATDIQMICCIDLSMTDDTGELFVTEGAAYGAGYAMGEAAARALVPLGVTIFECGNELDAKNGIRVPVQSVQGGVTEDFDNDIFPVLRGVLNGCMTAVRDVAGFTVLIGSNAFTACSFACADMLWDGTQPDGTSGHIPLRWDVTCWHNYACYGSLLEMSMDYEKPNANVLDHLRCKYGVPIFITEWNADEDDSDDDRTAHASAFLADMHAWRDTFDVRAVIVYQLVCGDPWGVVQGDGTVVENFGTTVRDFIAANPV
jgi:hypothetical protein